MSRPNGKSLKCVHPKTRAEVGAHLTKKPVDWDEQADELAMLAKVTPEDFQLETAPPEAREWRDRVASYRLPDDEFVAVRYQGRWYVFDSGL